MEGICDRCKESHDLDCYYKEETGEELWLCSSCGQHVNDNE
jgi:hypothetical protein